MRLLCPPNPSLIRLLLIFLAFSVNPRFCVKIPVDQQFLFKVTSQISLPILTPALNFCRLSWTCPRPAQQHSLLTDHTAPGPLDGSLLVARSHAHAIPLHMLRHVLHLHQRWTDRWMSGWFIHSFGSFSQGHWRKKEEPSWHTAHHCYQQLGDKDAFLGIPSHKRALWVWMYRNSEVLPVIH